MDDRRYFSRIKFSAQTQIECNNKVYEGKMLDISLKGALLHFKDHIPLEKSDHCVIRIYLHSSDITLVFDAELVHLCNNNLGFKFLSEDIDTITHLRKLLSLNVGDYDKITDELAFWLKG